MARKPRVELEGGLYHVITRGNNRQTIFHDDHDYQKFLAQLARQKRLLPFYLYAYCLMSNHVHLLIERQQDTIGRVMQRLLTSYSQSFNRRYRQVGHVLQGRYKAILCQSDAYLRALVRYIHLNPVRAQIVRRPEEYRYSSHRNYLGLATGGLVDVDPVLRHFGKQRRAARKRFQDFVAAGIKQGQRPEFYEVEEGSILGSQEFVDATIHRLGETPRTPATAVGRTAPAAGEVDPEILIAAVERAFGLTRAEFCGSGKSAKAVAAKEAMIVIARRLGINMRRFSETVGVSASTVSRRHEAAYAKLRKNPALRELLKQIEEDCLAKSPRIAISQA